MPFWDKELHASNPSQVIGSLTVTFSAICESFIPSSTIFSESSADTSALMEPETMLANELLETFSKERKAVAAVVDEFGGTSGIVTVEDVMEEIFGEIEDEHDKEVSVEEILSENNLRLSARLEVDYINKKYNLSLPESEFYETIGGLIAYNTGEIPQMGEKIEINPYVFTVTKVTSKKIEEINLIFKKEE